MHFLFWQLFPYDRHFVQIAKQKSPQKGPKKPQNQNMQHRFIQCTAQMPWSLQPGPHSHTYYSIPMPVPCLPAKHLSVRRNPKGPTNKKPLPSSTSSSIMATLSHTPYTLRRYPTQLFPLPLPAFPPSLPAMIDGRSKLEGCAPFFASLHITHISPFLRLPDPDLDLDPGGTDHSR